MRQNRSVKRPLNYLTRRLRQVMSNKGMTMAETLVAMALITIIGSILLIGTNSAFGVYTQASAISESQTLCSTLSTAIESELRYGKNITQEDGHVTFESTTFGGKCYITAENEGHLIVNIPISQNGSETVKTALLISKEAYTSGLKATAEITLDPQTGTINAAIAIGKDPEGNPYASRTMVIRPLNL